MNALDIFIDDLNRDVKYELGQLFEISRLIRCSLNCVCLGDAFNRIYSKN